MTDDRHEQIRRDQSFQYKLIAGQLIGGAAGLLIGAYLVLPALGDNWAGYLGAIAAIIVGGVIGGRTVLGV